MLLKHHLVIATAGGLLASCSLPATRPVETPAPEAPAWDDLSTMYESIPEPHGKAVAIGFFTKAEVQDPDWEAARLMRVSHAFGQHEICASKIGRSERWYPATKISGEPCAVLVYTMTCQSADADTERRLELSRQNLLAREPYYPMKRFCGEKNRKKAHFTTTTSEEDDREDRERIRKMLSSSARCDQTDVTAASRITVHPDTLFSIRSRVHPAILDRIENSIRWDKYFTKTESALKIMAYRDYKRDPTVARTAKVLNNGRNILVTETYARAHGADGYCVNLTAVQGRKKWSRSIWRTSFSAKPQFGMLDQMGLSKDPDSYWSPMADIKQLGFDLGENLGF